MTYKKKSMRLLGIIFVSVAILLSTHLGEFWPFSIYPMFSQAGRQWDRALVRDVTDVPHEEIWRIVHRRDELPGGVFAIDEVNLNTNDVANYQEKVEVWDRRMVNGMRHLFRTQLPERDLLLMKVNGNFTEARDSVIITYSPFMLMTQDTTIFNSDLDIDVRL
ncbi:MAG: hypothetical protein ACNA78_04685 [Balneolaceae bacterium]